MPVRMLNGSMVRELSVEILLFQRTGGEHREHAIAVELGLSGFWREFRYDVFHKSLQPHKAWGDSETNVISNEWIW